MNTDNFKKLQKILRNKVGKAVCDYNMIKNGDKIMVCMSGGKDSYTMLDLLLRLQTISPVKYSLVAVNLDQGHPNYPAGVLPEYLKSINVDYKIITQDTHKIVKQLIPEGKTMCSLCSRLRRGILYATAKNLGANKIALGHHKNDILETFFLNLFYNGTLKTMPPYLVSDDKQNHVIRPLAYCLEKEIVSYANYKKFPIIPCNLCGSQENLQRQVVRNMINEWEGKHNGRSNCMFRALQNVVPSHLLDKQLFNFG